MEKSKEKQPTHKSIKKDAFGKIQESFGPDDRGHYSSISRVSNSSTVANGLVISGPRGNGTI